MGGSGSTWINRHCHAAAGRSFLDKDVTFVDTDHDIEDELDAAYRSKYRRYSANRITSPAARSTTIKLVPRAT